MPTHEPPEGLSARLLGDAEMVGACRSRDFGKIFQLAKRGGFYPSLIARRVDLSASAVGEIIKGRRAVIDIAVVERIADGLRIPGHMLGLAGRDWEQPPREPFGAAPSTKKGLWPTHAGCL